MENKALWNYFYCFVPLQNLADGQPEPYLGALGATVTEPVASSSKFLFSCTW